MKNGSKSSTVYLSPLIRLEVLLCASVSGLELLFPVWMIRAFDLFMLCTKENAPAECQSSNWTIHPLKICIIKRLGFVCVRLVVCFCVWEVSLTAQLATSCKMKLQICPNQEMDGLASRPRLVLRSWCLIGCALCVQVICVRLGSLLREVVCVVRFFWGRLGTWYMWCPCTRSISTMGDHYLAWWLAGGGSIRDGGGFSLIGCMISQMACGEDLNFWID